MAKLIANCELSISEMCLLIPEKLCSSAVGCRWCCDGQSVLFTAPVVTLEPEQTHRALTLEQIGIGERYGRNRTDPLLIKCFELLFIPCREAKKDADFPLYASPPGCERRLRSSYRF